MMLNRISVQKSTSKLFLTQKTSLSVLGFLNQNRTFMKYFKSKNKEEEVTKPAKKKTEQTDFDALKLQQKNKEISKIFYSLGIVRDIYVFPDFKITDCIIHPIYVLKAIMYKFNDVSQSFLHVFNFKKAKPDQLQFNFFRESAIKVFYQVHHNFATNELSKVIPYVNNNVALALKKRRQNLDKQGYQLEWKVLEFKTTPSARNVTSIPLYAYNCHFISVGYKFDTIQQLTVKDKTGKVISDTTQRVVDNFIFLINTDTGSTVLQGKIPAKKMTDKPMTKTELGSHSNPQELFKKYADIFA